MGDEELEEPIEDEEEGQGDEGGGGKPAAKLPGLSPMLVKILMGTLGVIAVVGVTVVTSIVVSKNMQQAPAPMQQYGPEAKKMPAPAYFELGEFNQNTADKDQQHFVKVTVQLLYDKEAKGLLIEMQDFLPIFRDIVGMKLATKGYEWLQDAGNWETLKQEIMNEVNSRLTKGEVTGVIFDGFMVN